MSTDDSERRAAELRQFIKLVTAESKAIDKALWMGATGSDTGPAGTAGPLVHISAIQERERVIKANVSRSEKVAESRRDDAEEKKRPRFAYLDGLESSKRPRSTFAGLLARQFKLGHTRASEVVKEWEAQLKNLPPRTPDRKNRHLNRNLIQQNEVSK